MRARPKIDVLECTLRDGSYAIDYQFTAEDTAVLALGLERAGFRYIEIGHGLGLDASATAGRAAASDVDYLTAAHEALSEASFGTFLIPGVGSLNSLKRAAELGMGFVRIGTNVTAVDDAEDYILAARDAGLFVSSNLMKSYAVSTERLVEQAAKACAWGAHVVCVVDSAGGMLPDEVRAAVSALVDAVDCRVGYHGHNNLDLAIANTLAAAEVGATIVDSSLQGMGRSAGNAQTELLVMLLEKLGWDTGIDPFVAFDLGDRIIAPMAASRHGVDSLSASMGIAQFHSSFEPIVRAAAEKYSVDIRRLIVAVSEEDRVHVTEELAHRVAASLAATQPAPPVTRSQAASRVYLSAEPPEGDITDRAKYLADQMHVLSEKTGKPTVLTIAGSDAARTRFPYVRQNAGYIIGNAEVASLVDAQAVVQAVGGQVDWVLVDVGRSKFAELRTLLDSPSSGARTVPYDDLDALVTGVEAQLRVLLPPSGWVSIAGSGELAARFHHSFGEPAGCTANGNDDASGVAAVLVTDGGENDSALAAPHGPPIFDCRLTPQQPLAVGAQREVVRVDMRAGLSAAVITALETHALLHVARGSTEMNGVPVVAGGVLGRRGDVIVDSIGAPTLVIGIADGAGGLMTDSQARQYEDRVRAVREHIARLRFLG